MIAGTGGAFQAVLENSSLNNNVRNAIRAVLTGGSTTGMLTATNMTGTGSGEHGIFLSVAGGAILNTSTLTGVDVSNSGQLGNAGLADAVNIDVSGIDVSGMGSQATVNLINVLGMNTLGNTTQESGLRQVVATGGQLTTVVSGSNFSFNQISGINTRLRNAGTIVNLTVTGTTVNGGATSAPNADGFLFDNDSGNFTANVTTSSFNNSGRNAIRGLGGAPSEIGRAHV